uniref:hypothetical protein n=1 Tax=Armatimonas sp. TaxID=1872638 RepID=UPI00286BE0C1
MTQQKNKNTKNVLYSDKRLNKSFPKKKINEILLKKYLEQLSKFCEVKIFPHKAFENEKVFVSMNDVAVTDIMDCICGLFYTTWEKRGNGYILMPYTPGLQNHIPKSIHQKRSMEILNEFQELYTNAPKSLQNNLYFDENRGTKMLFEDLPKPLQDKISQFSENHLQVLSENRKPSNATTSLLENLKGSHIGFRVTNPNQRISQMELGIKKDNAFISVSIPNVIGEIKNQKSRKNDSSSYSCDSG